MAKDDFAKQNLAHGIADHGMTAEQEADARERDIRKDNREIAKEVKAAEKEAAPEQPKEANA